MVLGPEAEHLSRWAAEARGSAEEGPYPDGLLLEGVGQQAAVRAARPRAKFASSAHDPIADVYRDGN